jgi:hypothetical protein
MFALPIPVAKSYPAVAGKASASELQFPLGGQFELTPNAYVLFQQLVLFRPAAELQGSVIATATVPPPAVFVVGPMS